MSANWPCVSHTSSSAKIGESEGDKDGGFVRNAEGTLWLETNQGKDEIDRNPVYFLRHPHGECSVSSCGEKGKNRLSNEADGIKNDEFKRKNTGIVCRMTHNDGMK